MGRGLVSRRQDDDDRRRQLIEATAAGTALLDDDRAERDAWLNATMRDNLTDLEFNLLMLVCTGAAQAGLRGRQSGHTDHMTGAGCVAQDWIAHDPDPATAAELKRAATTSSRNGSPIR